MISSTQLLYLSAGRRAASTNSVSAMRTGRRGYHFPAAGGRGIPWGRLRFSVAPDPSYPQASRGSQPVLSRKQREHPRARTDVTMTLPTAPLKKIKRAVSHQRKLGEPLHCSVRWLPTYIASDKLKALEVYAMILIKTGKIVYQK